MCFNRKSKNEKHAELLISAKKERCRLAFSFGITVAMIVVVALGASAKNALLQGHVSKSNQSIQGAKTASNRYETLQHGYLNSGTDPMQAVMNGYVPPGMSPQQAAIIYNGLPNNLKMAPHMPQTASLDGGVRMAGEPSDPLACLPQGLSRYDVQAANQKMSESYIRERFGPVYVPPLHRNHNHVLEAAQPETHMKVTQDHQMSLFPAQYSYDSGAAPKSIREMTNSSGVVQSQYGYSPWGQVSKLSGTGSDSDMQYAGMYVHQRSGLNLTPHRAYSPSLGRWLSRDPIKDRTVRLMPRSPEPGDPRPGTVVHSDPALLAVLPMAGSITRHPVELNAYAYVANNPICWSDPSGTVIKLPDLCKIFPWLPGCKPKSCPANGDPGDEWNNCARICAHHGEGTPAWEDCMYRCLQPDGPPDGGD